MARKASQYVTYLTNLNQTNAYPTYPGIGSTPEESQENSRYYANQIPWVRTVAVSQAPKWAITDARSTRETELQPICEFGEPRNPTADELAEYEQIQMGRQYA